jgi:hypothetical protein
MTLRRERSDAELASWEKVLGGRRDTAFLKDRSPLYNADKNRGPRSSVSDLPESAIRLETNGLGAINPWA